MALITELWPHQADALQALRDTVAQGVRRICVQSPTGSGKTKLAAAIVDGARSKGNRIAFVVPAIDLIDQTVESFYAEGLTDVGVIQADHQMTDWSKPIQVCSIQTIGRRGRPEASIVVVDECHKLFQAQKDWITDPLCEKVVFIGLSATPWTKGLGKFYDTLIVAETTQGLIEKGFLSRFKAFAAGHPDLTGVKTVAGDYHEGQLSEAMQQGTLVADIIDTYKTRWGKGKTLVFGVDCTHAKCLQERFNQAGIPAGYQDAFTSMDERREIKRKFHNGDFQVVCNVGTLTMGVDWDVRCLVLARPTKSEMLYCLDAETEVLTSHGWRSMGQVKPGDCAATLTDMNTGRGCWSRVTGVVERDMSPSESWVEYDAPRANFRVTDKHTLIAASMNDKHREYRRMPASEAVSIKGGIKMPTAVTLDQVGVPLSDADLYFIGMMMSDGTWTSTSGSITQSERHPEVLERIEWSLRGCGIGYAKRRVRLYNGAIGERHPRWRFDFSAGKPRSHKSIGRAICGNDVKIAAEHVPGMTGFRHLMPYLDKDLAPALMAMSKAQLDRFLQGLWDGDGSKKKGVGYTPRSMEICSARPVMIDRLQALCAINGYTANVRIENGARRSTPIWLITITPKDWRSCGGYAAEDRGGRPQIRCAPATRERVWCVETETGTIVTRRRGKVTVMGNCQIIGRALRTNPEKEYALILDHSDTTSRLGLVTDIHHDQLDDGLPKQKAEKKKPLPKECKECGYLKPAGVGLCPNCGHQAKPPKNGRFEDDGELVEIDPAKAKRAVAKANGVADWTMGQKQVFFSELITFAEERGFKPGWAARKYKDRMGVWPNQLIKEPAAYVSGPTRKWLNEEYRRWKEQRDAGFGAYPA